MCSHKRRCLQRPDRRNGNFRRASDSDLPLCGREFPTQNFFRNRGRIGNSFDIEGSSGYRIEDGYLPQLKNVSGEILADQTPRELPDENLKVRRAEIYQQSSGVYNVEVYAENGGNGFLFGSH